MSKIKLKDLEAMLDAKISAILDSKSTKEEQEIEIEIEDETTTEENIVVEDTKIEDLQEKINQLEKKNKEWETMWNSQSNKKQETAQPRKGWGNN